jgi:hypothetical protein
MQHRTSRSFRLIQIGPLAPPTFRVVWAEPVDDKEGPHYLTCEPFDLLGLAEVTETYYDSERVPKETMTYTDVVALSLVEGYWHILNEYDKCAGIMKEGQPITNCTGELSSDIFKLLREE